MMAELVPHRCAEQMHWHLNLQHFGDTNMKYLEVQGACKVCGAKASFRGSIGVSPKHPTVAADGHQAVLPFVYEGEIYDGKAVGYILSAKGAN